MSNLLNAKPWQVQAIRGVYPQIHCIACRQEAPLDALGLCEECADALEATRETFCPTDRYATVYTPLPYWGVAADLVKQLKFRHKIACALPLAIAMAKLVADMNWRIDAIVPVPLSPKQLRKRGYNHSEVLADELGCLLQIPVQADGLRRTRETKTQHELPASERYENVMGAFAGQNVAGRHILLIDDVCTTGATADVCRRALLDAGARSVRVVCATNRER